MVDTTEDTFTKINGILDFSTVVPIFQDGRHQAIYGNMWIKNQVNVMTDIRYPACIVRWGEFPCNLPVTKLMDIV